MAVAILRKNEIGTKLAHFYAFNSAGAVVGALLSGIVFIPHFGLDGTLYIAASLNIFIMFGMTPPRYTDEFKMEAVKKVTVNGYSVNKTAERLGDQAPQNKKIVI